MTFHHKYLGWKSTNSSSEVILEMRHMLAIQLCNVVCIFHSKIAVSVSIGRFLIDYHVIRKYSFYRKMQNLIQANTYFENKK